MGYVGLLRLGNITSALGRMEFSHLEIYFLILT